MKKFILLLWTILCFSINAQAEIDPAQAYAVALKGTPSDLKKLLHAGYDVNRPHKCNTLLTAAIKSGAEEPVLPETPDDTLRKITLLLNAGADVNFTPCPESGMLPLSWAIALPLLIEEQEKEAINAFENQVTETADYCDYQVVTPKPCRYLTEEEQQKIKNHIHEQFALQQQKLKPLHMRIIKLLLKRGAIVDKSDLSAQTPLLYASALPGNYALETVQYLLSKGASTNTINAENQTPLFFAHVRNHPDVVNILMEYGADPTVQDSRGFLFNQSKTATFRTVMSDEDSILLEILY